MVDFNFTSAAQEQAEQPPPPLPPPPPPPPLESKGRRAATSEPRVSRSTIDRPCDCGVGCAYVHHLAL
ncbi:unnamed protein product [Merluccius merluccius]